MLTKDNCADEETPRRFIFVPLVREHPMTGRLALHGSPQGFSRFLGLGATESWALMEEAMDFATAEEFCHSHRWRAGDSVLWGAQHPTHHALASTI